MESDLLDFLVHPQDLTTAHRPIRLRLDCSTQLSDDMLLPQRVYGAESICGGLEYRILCVSARAQLPLREFIGLRHPVDYAGRPHGPLARTWERRMLKRVASASRVAASDHASGLDG